MKLGSVTPMNFKGIYELKGTERAKTAKNVPADTWQKGNEGLTFVNLTYRPFIDEVVDENKIKNAIPGVLVEHYYEPSDRYCTDAVVSKVEIGKTLNCTQDEWERAHEEKIESTIPNLEEHAHCVQDMDAKTRFLSPEEETAIKEAN